jgi:uncharacterized integral membrane protein
LVAVKFLVSLFILTVLVVFALMNMEPDVTVKFYEEINIGPVPLSFAILGAAALGSLITALITLVEQMRLRYQLRKERTRVEELELELLEFRKQPPEPIRDEEAGSEETAPRRLPSYEGEKPAEEPE